MCCKQMQPVPYALKALSGSTTSFLCVYTTGRSVQDTTKVWVALSDTNDDGQFRKLVDRSYVVDPQGL
jgi:hypothetical protein